MRGIRCGPPWLSILIGATTTGCLGDSPSAEAPTLQFERLVSISPAAKPFGQIADIELGDDGTLYVLDAQHASVRLFDQQGTEISEFGGRGRGPGEFERPAKLLWRPNGELWVLDPGAGRFSSYDATGELLETYPLPDVGIVFPFAVAFESATTLRAVGLSSPDLTNLTAAWAETSLEGEEWTPADTRNLPFVRWPETFTLESDGMVMVLPVPFSGEPQFEFDETGRLWYATTASPVVHLWSSDSGLASFIEIDVPAEPVTPQHLEEALANPDFDELKSLGDAAVNRFSDLVPQERPPIAGFFFDEQGEIWVAHGSELGEGTRSHRVSIFDREGTLVGTAELELTVAPRPRVRGGVLATVVRDQLGVESIQPHRVGR